MNLFVPYTTGDEDGLFTSKCLVQRICYPATDDSAAAVKQVNNTEH